MQLAIFLGCAWLYFYRGAPLTAVAGVFLVMQLGAMLGAAVGTRLMRKIEDRRDRLPLDKS